MMTVTARNVDRLGVGMRGVALVALFLVLSGGCSASSSNDSKRRVSLQIKLMEYTQGTLPPGTRGRSRSSAAHPVGRCRSRRGSAATSAFIRERCSAHRAGAGCARVARGHPSSRSLRPRKARRPRSEEFRSATGREARHSVCTGARRERTSERSRSPSRACAVTRNPVLLAQPTPFASAAACVYGHWTPRTERLIQIVERSRAIARLRPRRLFPHDIGVLPCTIPMRGPVTGRTLAGRCGVYVKHVWSRPAVTLVEVWPRGSNGVHRHVWRFVVRHGNAFLENESGSPLPQDLE